MVDAERGQGMILRVDPAAADPIYLQIRMQIVEAVADGSLRPGDALPSVRRLASDLGINLHTVNKAYAVLRDEGYVIVKGRSGAFVADAEDAQPEKADAEHRRMASALRQLALEHKARGGTRAEFEEEAARAAASAFQEGER